MRDAATFVRYFVQGIASNAPHVYLSALTFALKCSVIAQQYAPKFKNILQLELGRLDSWPIGDSVLRSHSDSLNFIAFSPDGKRLVSSSRDKTVRIWDVDASQIGASTLQCHKNDALCAVFSADDKSILSVSTNGTIQTWDINSAIVDGPVNCAKVAVDGTRSCAVFSSSRKYVASAHSEYATVDNRTASNVVIVQDVSTGNVIARPFEGHKDAIRCVAISPDDTLVAAGSDDKTICVWDRQTGELVAGPLIGHQGPVLSNSYSRDSSLIASGSTDGTVRLWSVRWEPPQLQLYKGHTDSVNCVAFSSDARWIVTGS